MTSRGRGGRGDDLVEVGARRDPEFNLRRSRSECAPKRSKGNAGRVGTAASACPGRPLRKRSAITAHAAPDYALGLYTVSRLLLPPPMAFVGPGAWGRPPRLLRRGLLSLLAKYAAMCIIQNNGAPRIAMRTNIVIDDQLLEQALRATGLKTKRAVVEAGLRMLLHLKGQEDILRLVGQVRWEGDLDKSRQGRDLT